jgi:hypothetical protein
LGTIARVSAAKRMGDVVMNSRPAAKHAQTLHRFDTGPPQAIAG